MPGALTHSPADIMAKLLVGLGAGSEPSESAAVSWPVYASRLPSEPGDCIAVVDAPGRKHGREAVTSEVCQHEGFRVFIRAGLHADGWAKADAVKQILDSILDRTVSLGSSSYVVHSVTRGGPVQSIGAEAPESKRCVFAISAVASMRTQN